MRVFIGPVEIAGIAQGLSQGLRKFGVDANVILASSHRFKYGNESTSWLVYFWQKLGAARRSIPRNKWWLKIFVVFLHGFWGGLVLLSALKKYDIFIFFYGQTITNSEFELWVLKKSGRKIIFVGLGSDTRPPYIDGGLFAGNPDGEYPDPGYLIEQTKRCKERIKRQERYATYWINSPAAAHFHEKPFIGWPALGIPRDLTGGGAEVRIGGGPVRVLHSPSSPLAKGTPVILGVIEKLKARGYEIDFVLVQNLPNNQVLLELERCDFVIDQLYSDAPMAGFATEAAYFGKPAVVGGYFASVVGKCFAEHDIPPSLFVLPDQMEAAIEKLILDQGFRLELGKKARDFVENRWALKAIATRFLRLLQDDVPEEWWCDPNKLCYLEGSGLHRDRVRRLVASVIEYGGISALQLGDKPHLERAFLDFSKSG